MDYAFTESIRVWLETPREERDVAAGAELLLRIDGNRQIYNLAMKRPEAAHDHIEADLAKHLNIRLQGHTVESVRAMEQTLMPQVEEMLEDAEGAENADTEGENVAEGAAEAQRAPRRGKRPDHAELPEHIRAIYDRGGEIYEKIRHTFAELQGMEKDEPCDRFEKLKVLEELYKAYHEGWETYDAFDPEAETPEPDTETPDTATVIKKVEAARKFISTHTARLENLIAGEAPDEEEVLRKRKLIQERVEIVKENGGGFAPAFAQRLKAVGIVVP